MRRQFYAIGMSDSAVLLHVRFTDTVMRVYLSGQVGSVLITTGQQTSRNVLLVHLQAGPEVAY